MRSTLLRLKTPPYGSEPPVYLLDMWMQIPGLYPITPISFYNQRNAPYCRMVAFLKILLFIANHEFLKEKRCFPTFLHACFFFTWWVGKKKKTLQPLPPFFGQVWRSKKCFPKKESNQQKNEDPMGVLMTCLLFLPYKKPQKKKNCRPPKKSLSCFCLEK